MPQASSDRPLLHRFLECLPGGDSPREQHTAVGKETGETASAGTLEQHTAKTVSSVCSQHTLFIPHPCWCRMQPVARTRQGAVQGSAADGVAAFKGIPYAAPPFGPNRFQPPRPAESWEGVRTALTYGPTAPKVPYFPPFDVLLPEVDIAGSDYLNLNIWSPDLGQARLPVMVWIHGGSFVNGSGSLPTYDGTC